MLTRLAGGKGGAPCLPPGRRENGPEPEPPGSIARGRYAANSRESVVPELRQSWEEPIDYAFYRLNEASSETGVLSPTEHWRIQGKVGVPCDALAHLSNEQHIPSACTWNS
jgi:hypothetical protein